MELCHVTFLRFSRPASAIALALVFTSAPVALSAQAPGPTPQELAKISAAGSYLAARHAGQQRDARTAAAYYRATLRHDPKNGELLDRTFLSLLVAGEVDDAEQLPIFAYRQADADFRGIEAEVLIPLLAEDVAWSMPPLASWFRGLADVRGFLAGGPLNGEWRWKRLATTANGAVETRFDNNGLGFSLLANYARGGGEGEPVEVAAIAW